MLKKNCKRLLLKIIFSLGPKFFEKLKKNFFLNLKIETNENLSHHELYEKLELILIERSSQTEDVNKQKINPKIINENKFILGQFYFEYVRKIIT